ncbi:PREDICTED: dynamin-related protein 4C-like [Fragaria vesca subsp. vesca]|uniref:dynamin-related protein 4C-like n=1 Tax=Fragaria vesca subsp. vesca TaxID=101020 RepID=UPI0002C36CDB|nr:PREDICTED: dynamin-related protein 4C-like [Fragaria vesca subsp. vesca]
MTEQHINVQEFNLLPAAISSVDEARDTFMQLVALCKESLRKLLLRGEFVEYPDDRSMHGTVNLAMELYHFKDALGCFHHIFSRRDIETNFLQSVIKYCTGKAGDHAAELTADLTSSLAEWEHRLHARFLKSFWWHVIMEVTQVVQWIQENHGAVNVNEEKQQENFSSEYTRLMSKCNDFIYGVFDDPHKPATINVDGIGEIVVGNLRSYSRDLLSEAFSTYWPETYIDVEIMQILKMPVFAHLFEDMLEKYPLARKSLEKRINILMKAKEICEGTMDDE